MYGDVHRVKMHYHKPDTAFVQFSTIEQAERAIKLLHGQQVFGRRLRVFYSHLQEIQLHQAQTGPDGQPLTVRLNRVLLAFRTLAIIESNLSISIYS